MPTIIQFKNYLISKGPSMQIVAQTFFNELDPECIEDEVDIRDRQGKEEDEQLQWAGDLDDFMAMTNDELKAWVDLMHAMNFIWWQSGHKPQPDGTVVNDDWIGSGESWHGVNRFWLETYPYAYRTLETWVWG